MSRSALLLMDLQAGILPRMPEDYLPHPVRALGAARAAGVRVVHIGVRLREGHADVHPRNKVFGALPPGVFTAADPGAAFHPDVAPADGELVVHKNRVSAFAAATTCGRSWPPRTSTTWCSPASRPAGWCSPPHSRPPTSTTG